MPSSMRTLSTCSGSILLALLLLPGCSRPDRDVVGSWRVGDSYRIMTLAEDGRVNPGEPSLDTVGRWWWENGVLMVQVDVHGGPTHEAEIHGSEMRLGKGDNFVLLTRIDEVEVGRLRYLELAERCEEYITANRAIEVRENLLSLDSSSCFASGLQGDRERVLTLMASAVLFSERAPLVDAILGADWATMPPMIVNGFKKLDRVLDGVESLCTWLESQPSERGKRSRTIRSWVDSYATVEILIRYLNVEGLAAAVAHVPETRIYFPRNTELIQELGPRVGETLASAEHPGLWIHLATYMGTLDIDRRRELVIRLLQTGSDLIAQEK